MAELQYTSLIGDANLKAYYRMSSGALTTDSSGNGKTLTNSNSVAESANGKFSGGADLGSSDLNKRLYISDNLGLVRHAQSISFWVKCNVNVSSGYARYDFISTNNTTYKDGITIYYYYNGGNYCVAVVYYMNGVAPGGEATYSVNLGTSSWHHLVMTWTGDNTANGLKLYLDGSNVINVTTSVGSGSVSNNVFNIGSGEDGSYDTTLAMFDDVAVFDRVLSSSEISMLYSDLPATTNLLKQYRRTRIPGLISGI